MKIKRTSMVEFAENVIGKRGLYCFGAGKTLSDFCMDCMELGGAGIEGRIRYAVDNDKEKQNRDFEGVGRRIPVISPQEMRRRIMPGDAIVVTAKQFDRVAEQLDAYSELEDTDCYIYYLLRMEQDDYDRENIAVPEDLSTEPEMCIPKIIHYCWFGGGEIPEQNRRWMESWKRYCPDYRIIQWNEDNYDVSKNLYMRQAYQQRKWAFVSDYARMDVIERYGGVYLDTDVELLKSLDPLLKNKAFCGFESRKYVAFGLGFGAVRNHGIIRRLRDDYGERRFLLEDGRMNETTCPIYQTELLQRLGLKRDGRFQKLEGITVYPARILCGMSPFHYRILDNLEDTYAIHHFTGTWLDQGDKERNQYMSRFWDRLGEQ